MHGNIAKILLLDELIAKVRELQKNNKKVVLSYGIYDIIHPGIVIHLNEAKALGDVLVVAVVKDKDIRMGPGRPIFPEEMRAVNAATCAQVDYVCLVDDEITLECVKKIKPDVFAKGQSYRASQRNVDEKLSETEKSLKNGQVDIFQTSGLSFSSSHIINNFLDIYPAETKNYLTNFKRKYSFESIADRINGLKDLNILLIGDGIIDEYHYTTPLGRSSKANMVVNKYLAHEVFAGGAFAIANHMAGICKKVHLVSLVGYQDSREEFIIKNLKPGIEAKLFKRDEAPTVVKKRYIQQQNNQKLFEVNYLNDEYVNGGLEASIIAHIKDVATQYDVVLISDFGHGLVTKKIFDAIKESSVRFGINTQTNGANVGFNLITKYSDPFFICLDEGEVRLASQERFGNVEDIIMKLSKRLSANNIIVTRGKNGSVGINEHGEFSSTPIFSSKVVDTVGAGDAFFAYTAPCLASGMPLDLVSFIGNAVGALAVQIVGNKKSVEKHELLEFMHTIMK
jgi:rfaE bifunctional protein kinase chain/domain